MTRNDLESQQKEQEGASRLLHWPGTNTLWNAYGLIDEEQLRIFDRNFSAGRAALIPPEGWAKDTIGEELRTVHRFLFSSAYPWAGKFRTIEITRPNSLFEEITDDYISNFAAANEIGSQLSLANTLAKGLTQLSVSDRIPLLGVIHGTLDFAHPFIEGNGRAVRATMECLAYRNGVALAWPQEETLVATLADAAQLDPQTAPDVWADFYEMICTPLTPQEDNAVVAGRALVDIVGLAGINPVSSTTQVSANSDRKEQQETRVENNARPMRL